MRKIIFVLLFLLSNNISFAADKFALTGNWISTSTWSNTSGGSPGASIPTISDNAIFDVNSSNVIINGSAICKSLNFTNYSGILNTSGIKNATLNIDASSTWTGTVNITGNSNVNRLYLYYGTITNSTPGTAVINNNGATVNLNYIDFRDINFTTPIDLSSNSSGDCGGNTNITFTLSQDQHWINTSGSNWSDTTSWTSRVPLPQDDVYMDCFFNASQSVTADMPRLGKTIDWTGATGSPNFLLSTPVLIFGGLNLTGVGTFVPSTKNFHFYGRNSFSLDLAGSTIYAPAFYMINGNITFNSDINCSAKLDIRHGSINANNFNVTTPIIESYQGGNRTLIMGNGTWNITGSATILNLGGSTIICNSSLIEISSISSDSKTLSMGANTFNNLTIYGGGVGSVRISGNNTFNSLTVYPPKLVTFINGTTQKMNIFSAIGNESNRITLNSTAASGSFSYLSDLDGGINTLKYCDISDITANATAAKWRAFNLTNTHLRTAGFQTTTPIVIFSNITLENVTVE